MNLFVAGLSYKTAPVEVREQAALPRTGLRCCGCRLQLRGGLAEVVVLSTCNRVEIYGVAPRGLSDFAGLFRQFGAGQGEVGPYLYVRQGAEAVRHLFAVAGGLDSMVIGETEITGQVKDAYQGAHAAGLTGRVLNRLFQTALQTAKEIRTQTQVGRGAASVGSVAVELAEKIFDGALAPRSVLIIGAGKMGEACVKHLAKKGVRSVAVANRSWERAEALAREFNGRPVRFEDRFAALAEADIVVSSTGAAQAILDQASVAAAMRARRQRPLFLVDIAVPRDIDPAVQWLENVYLYNIDDLEGLVRETLRLREAELAQCQAIIEQRAAAVLAKLQPPAPHPEAVPHPQPGWIYGGAPA